MFIELTNQKNNTIPTQMYTLALRSDHAQIQNHSQIQNQNSNTNQIKESQMPPQLTPASLFENQSKMDSLRLDVFNRILGMVHQRIRATAKLPKSPQMTHYSVSEWQPGCPSFDVKQCILYIITNLRNSGFDVLYVPSNRILISWLKHSEQYYTEESPIRQALIASATSKNTKLNQMSQMAQSDKEQGKKKPSNYKPMSESMAGIISASASSSAPTQKKTITFI